MTNRIYKGESNRPKSPRPSQQVTTAVVLQHDRGCCITPPPSCYASTAVEKNRYLHPHSLVAHTIFSTPSIAVLHLFLNFANNTK